MAVCLVGVGANLGDRIDTHQRARDLLDRQGAIRVVASSRQYESLPVGGPADQPRYLNAAWLLETSLAPHALLDVLKDFEPRLGRASGERWGARAIDLDLLLYDDLQLADERLVLPHARMTVRRFVLEPAAEVAPDMLHPTTGLSMAAHVAHLDRADSYIAIAGPAGSSATELAEAVAEQSGARHISSPTLDPLLREPPFASAVADSSGPAAGPAVELLRGRARALARGSAARHSESTISDFWLPQSLVDAELSGTGDVEVQRLKKAWNDRGEVLEPAVLVVLEAGRGEIDSIEDARRTTSTLETMRRVAPASLLRLPSDDPQRAATEILAAFDGIRPGTVRMMDITTR